MGLIFSNSIIIGGNIGGGGGGGTTDYNDLTNKPSINGVTLQGALTSDDLSITAGVAVEYEDIDNGNE